MKPYSSLNIDQKINYKANILAKTIAFYDSLPSNGWYIMKQNSVYGDLSTCYMYDALYSFNRTGKTTIK